MVPGAHSAFRPWLFRFFFEARYCLDHFSTVAPPYHLPYVGGLRSTDACSSDLSAAFDDHKDEAGVTRMVVHFAGDIGFRLLKHLTTEAEKSCDVIAKVHPFAVNLPCALCCQPENNPTAVLAGLVPALSGLLGTVSWFALLMGSTLPGARWRASMLAHDAKDGTLDDALAPLALDAAPSVPSEEATSLSFLCDSKEVTRKALGVTSKASDRAILTGMQRLAYGAGRHIERCAGFGWHCICC
ncbi:hypothetical protein K437DRAFT_189649 [Tilletiaria anomala UBC 951]|uniref:Uncharacterized protein n=1 Tax=Tilletiaria anomala (strain ATCC 24038 / CBS 436.72 / UBC 951) TaxID=1037660 RepID=A0A066VPE9_TILAU|nr:uncharacterized protein K437DRAFT_189649 [Tilletiaria anomala UBC 951]KDN40440.1 hypothetical protein K437DRAFT_189649 [Tilletiaria anomala UBC 951]